MRCFRWLSARVALWRCGSGIWPELSQRGVISWRGLMTQMAEYVFAHRLMLSSKARLNEYTPEAIVAEVLAQTQPPVLSERRA